MHLVREGGQLAHEAGVEQVAFGDAVADEAAADGVVGERGEYGGERLALRSRAAAPLEVHHVEKTVVDIARIGLVYEVVRDAVVYKGFDVIFHRLSIVKYMCVGGKDLGLVRSLHCILLAPLLGSEAAAR